jgi:hypothetical protein
MPEVLGMQPYQRRKDFIRHGAIRLRDPLAHHRPHCHTHTADRDREREEGRERGALAARGRRASSIDHSHTLVRTE